MHRLLQGRLLVTYFKYGRQGILFQGGSPTVRLLSTNGGTTSSTGGSTTTTSSSPAPSLSSANHAHFCDSILLIEKNKGVMTLILNRPKQRNALNFKLLQRLKDTLSELQDDVTNMETRAVVVVSNGPSFCSGHDLKEIQTLSTSDDRKALFHLCSEVMNLWSLIPQPTIAAVHGMATAAGCQLAASADITIASSDAKFMTPGANLGLFCSTPAVPLIRTIPRKIAMDMLFTGRILSAQEALACGLISRVVDSRQGKENIESVRVEAQKLASLIASKSGYAMRHGKHTLSEQSCLDSIEEAYAVASAAMAKDLESEDAQIGIDAFVEKRLAEWKHK